MKHLLLVMIPILVVAGCSHNKAAAPVPIATTEPTAASQASPAAVTQPSAENAAKTVNMPLACNEDTDCDRSELCVGATCTEITAQLAECGSIRVHFEFDKTALHPGDKQLLDRAARCIMAQKGISMLISGNADERGTGEYNLGLGDRRAKQVASYLEHQGVPANQLATVSYGEERPLCPTQDEECWAQNRRSKILAR